MLVVIQLLAVVIVLLTHRFEVVQGHVRGKQHPASEKRCEDHHLPEAPDAHD